MWKAIASIITTILPILIPLFKRRVTKPKNHTFFGEISRQRKYVIPGMKLYSKGKYDKGRTMIFQDMLNVKLRVWEDVMYRTVQKKNCSKDDMTAAIEEIVNTYNKEWLDMGVPQIVIEKFNLWHAERTSSLLVYMESIMDGHMFNSSDEKINASLFMHTALVFATIDDANYTLGRLNGEITGKVYKGETLS